MLALPSTVWPPRALSVSFPNCSMCQLCYITPCAVLLPYFSFRKDPGLHLLCFCVFCLMLLSAVSALGCQCSLLLWCNGCPRATAAHFNPVTCRGKESMVHRAAALFPQRKLCVGWKLTAFNDYMLNLLPINN